MGEVAIPRGMFLWSMAIVYVFAFASLYIQIPGKKSHFLGYWLDLGAAAY